MPGDRCLEHDGARLVDRQNLVRQVYLEEGNPPEMIDVWLFAVKDLLN